jgi:hypothetical protein
MGLEPWLEEKLNATVWKTITHPERNILFLEVRNEASKKVTFSGVDLDARMFLFRDLEFEEPWWISLAESSGNIVLFTFYTDTNNPDKKTILAFDFVENKTVWWRNNYAISGVTDNTVFGSETGLGTKFLVLGLADGLPAAEQTVTLLKENFLVHKPLQYHEETSHFETVRSFLSVKHQVSATSLIEYLEYRSLLFISFYVAEADLANYLIVLDENGDVLLRERLGEHLKGIGSDTFFILSGYLIFVKNKNALVSYKLI